MDAGGRVAEEGRLKGNEWSFDVRVLYMELMLQMKKVAMVLLGKT
jgi:hypothetical protein